MYNNNTKIDSTYQDRYFKIVNINLFHFFIKPTSKLFCSNESKEKFESNNEYIHVKEIEWHWIRQKEFRKLDTLFRTRIFFSIRRTR